MRGRVVVMSLASIVLASFATVVSAQVPASAPTAIEAAVLCGPPVGASAPPANALRIQGAQDPSPRRMFSKRDLLIVRGGTEAGVQLGQEFFVRRVRGMNPYSRPTNAPISTIAVIRVVAVNENTAIASVQHACDAILFDDYLEPFEMPSIAGDVDRDASTGELDFTDLAQVVGGREGRTIGATGDLMVMDRGSDQGVEPGSRFAIYRDLKVAGLPLAAIGDAVVLTTGEATSVVRLTRIRDAVRAGDYLVPRK